MKGSPFGRAERDKKGTGKAEVGSPARVTPVDRCLWCMRKMSDRAD